MKIDSWLKVRYIKLHFKLKFIEDCKLPVNKVSGIRGGIGEMLLRSNCIRDRKCDECDFETECLVRRTMYSKYEIQPETVSGGDSIGYVVECENYETDFTEDSFLSFNLILFGKSIVYFSQYVQALYALGMNGLGKNKARFSIAGIQNTNKQELISGDNILMEHYVVHTLENYVNYRMKKWKKGSAENLLRFCTPLALKHHGKVLREYDFEVILDAIRRRLFLLNCFEGFVPEDITDNLYFETSDHGSLFEIKKELPAIVNEEHFVVAMDRYSSRQNQHMKLWGIKGRIELSEIPEELLPWLFAGELIHIGSNTSFGFGRFCVR